MRILSFVFCLAMLASLSSCAAQGPDSRAGGPAIDRIGPILRQAEGLFRNMRARDYPTVWALLSTKSRETIVGDVLKESGGAGGGFAGEEQIAQDFAKGGAIARAYWEGYLQEFDPDTALRESRWEMGEVGEDSAVIRITHKGSERPAVLRMVREGGVWKVGLIETFRPRPLQ